MIIDIKVPAIGESVTEVTLATWLKKDGDYVAMDESICEFDSDKASMELPAEKAGKLEIVAQEGDDLQVGDLVARIDTSVAAPAGNEAPKASPVEQKAEVVEEVSAEVKITGEPVEMKVPTIGESVTEVVLAQWLVEDGAFVEIDDPICEFESDKANLEFPAEFSGVVTYVAKVEDELQIGDAICTLTPATGSKAKPKTAEKVETPAAKVDANYATGHASPAASKMMAEKNVTSAQIGGSGKNGRITKGDVLSYLQANPNAGLSEATKSVPTAFSRDTETKKMSKLRQTIAKRLVNVKNKTAMLTTFNEVDLTAVKAIRTKYKAAFKEKHGVNLGFMSFFSRAVALALKDFPAVNARLDDKNIVYHNYVDISIAVSTPKGLVVPVVRNVESLSLWEIEAEIKRLALKGRDGKLTMQEMQGGTFTITNGGVFGSLMSTPIINEPQSAILGMHSIQDRPVAVNGKVEIRPMMYLAVSYDHRIIDGKESVSFLVRVKENLENPERLLLGKNPIDVLLDM